MCLAYDPFVPQVEAHKVTARFFREARANSSDYLVNAQPRHRVLGYTVALQLNDDSITFFWNPHLLSRISALLAAAGTPYSVRHDVAASALRGCESPDYARSD
jgi:hypothetical protein